MLSTRRSKTREDKETTCRSMMIDPIAIIMCPTSMMGESLGISGTCQERPPERKKDHGGKDKRADLDTGFYAPHAIFRRVRASCRTFLVIRS